MKLDNFLDNNDKKRGEEVSLTRGKFSLDRKKKRKKEKRKEKRTTNRLDLVLLFFITRCTRCTASLLDIGTSERRIHPRPPPSFLLRSFFAKSLVDLSRATTRLSINQRIYSPFHAFVLLQNAKWKIVKNFTLPLYE